jgi:ribokinase
MFTYRTRDCFKKIKTSLNLFLVQGVKEVLVKLGSQGSALFVEGEEPIRQPIIPATEVIDTTGAGDTFTSAFAVALVEGKHKECIRFAGTKSRPLQYLIDWFPCILI